MKWLTRKNLVWAIVAVLTLAAVVVPLSIVTGVGRPDTLVGTAVVGALWCGCMLALLSLLETPGRLVHARMGMVAATVCAVMFVAGLWLQLRWWRIGQPLLLVSLSLTVAAIANGVVILAAGTPGVRAAGRRGDGLTTIACGVGWVLGGVLLLVSAAIVGNDRVQIMMAVIGAGVLISGAAIGANFAGVEAMRSGGWRVVGAGFTLLALVCLIAQTFWDTDVRLRRPDVQHPEIYGSLATIGITMGVWNLLAHSARSLIARVASWLATGCTLVIGSAIVLGSAGALPQLGPRLNWDDVLIALGFVGVCAAGLVFVLRFMQRGTEAKAYVPADGRALEVEVCCPRCSLRQVIEPSPWPGSTGAGSARVAKGVQRCAGCGLRLRVSVTMPLCDQCGYDLSNARGEICPECGHAETAQPGRVPGDGKDSPAVGS